MSFSQLPDDAIIEALEHADPRSILRLSATSKRVNDIISQCSALQYPVEITRARMIDGPPNHVTPNMRLAQFRSHQAAWATLQAVLITPPLVFGPWSIACGLSNGYMNQIRSNVLFPYALDLYKLHNPYGQNTVKTLNLAWLPQSVIVDPSQTVVMMAVVGQDHTVNPPADLLQFVGFNLKQDRWIEQLPALPYDFLGYPRRDIRVRQMEIKVRSNTILIGVVTSSIVNGKEVWDFSLCNTAKGIWTRLDRCSVSEVMSFQFIYPGFVLVALKEQRKAGRKGKPVLNLYHDQAIDGLPLTSLHFPAWQISHIDIRPNTSPSSETDICQDTLFYQDPLTRILVFVIEFVPNMIPVGCAKRMFWIFNEGYFLPSGPHIVIPYRRWSVDGIHGNGPDGVASQLYNVVGRRLMVPDMKFMSPNRPQSRIMSLSFRTHRTKGIESDSMCSSHWGEPMLSFKATEHHIFATHIRPSGGLDVLTWELRN